MYWHADDCNIYYILHHMPDIVYQFHDTKNGITTALRFYICWRLTYRYTKPGSKVLPPSRSACLKSSGCQELFLGNYQENSISRWRSEESVSHKQWSKFHPSKFKNPPLTQCRPISRSHDWSSVWRYPGDRDIQLGGRRHIHSLAWLAYER